jgi:Phasin protein
MSKSVTAVPTTAANQSAAASELNNQLSDPWIRATSTSVQITSALGNEAIRFASRRFARNRDAVEQLTRCASWPDLLELQMSWAKDIMQDYLDESREFLGLVQGASNAAETASGDRPAANERSTESERASSAKHATA